MIIWTTLARWITFSNYRNGFTDKPIDTKVIEVEDNGEDITVTSHTGFGGYTYGEGSLEANRQEVESAEERLRKLQRLYDQALITREEYDQKKKEILDEL